MKHRWLFNDHTQLEEISFAFSIFVYLLKTHWYGIFKNRNKIWHRFTEENSEFKKLHQLENTEVVFLTKPELKPALKILAENQQGEIQSILINKDSQLISKTRVGSNLTDMIDSPSLAYPTGPKKSELTSILLNRKLQPEGLANSLIEVNSLSPNKIIAGSSLEFQPSDERFDQVQAFYFS